MRRAVVGALVAGGAGATYASQPPESKSRWQFAAFDVLNPVLRALVDGESAHIAAVAAASRGWIPTEHRPDCSSLRVTVWGLKFTNPIGLAAGFDKHAEAYPALLDMGFGFVEIGSVTPLPQDGNPKPRVFRLPADRAVINRYGFNSQGHKAAADRLAAHPTGSVRGVLGVNLGKNKVQPDASADYVAGVHELAESLLSPSPGLRSCAVGQRRAIVEGAAQVSLGIETPALCLSTATTSLSTSLRQTRLACGACKAEWSCARCCNARLQSAERH